MTPTGPLSQPEPTPPGPRPAGGAAWGQLVETALRSRGAALQDPTAPLRSGEIAPQALCRYAAGHVTAGERADVEGTLLRHPGALGLVTALVRGARADGGYPLPRRLLAEARQGELQARRAAGLAVLEARGDDALCEAAQRGERGVVERAGDDAVARAACHLALGEVEPARAALDGVSVAEDPLVAALRGAAAAPDEDEALIALLASLG